MRICIDYVVRSAVLIENSLTGMQKRRVARGGATKRMYECERVEGVGEDGGEGCDPRRLLRPLVGVRGVSIQMK